MNAIVLFEEFEIRRIWDEEQEAWYFVVNDIVQALTQSKDVRQYIKRMRQRDPELQKRWGTICTPHAIETEGGKQRMNCANIEGILRIIQAIPSPRAEPFKLWLAEVGFDRIQEMQNPELAAHRARALYKAQGYSDKWIEARLQSIETRTELTQEWKTRGVAEPDQQAELTEEISKETFAITPDEHKKLKGLDKQNLRDHMTKAELVFTMLGEVSTTEIARSEDAKGFDENKEAARKGGKIAGRSRKLLESESGHPIVSKSNYLEKPEDAQAKLPPDDKES